MKNRLSNITWVPAIGLLFYGQPAFAYLDPGTGSILLQGIIAGVAGVFVVLKLYWYRIKNFFSPKGAKGISKEIQDEYATAPSQLQSDPKDSAS